MKEDIYIQPRNIKMNHETTTQLKSHSCNSCSKSHIRCDKKEACILCDKESQTCIYKTTNLKRCDQCTSAHRKCDKKEPSCSLCITKGKKCTYLNKKESIKFFYYTKSSEHKLLVRKDKQVGMGEFKFKITKSPSNLNYNYTPLGIINSITNYDILQNLMSKFQFPSPYKLNNQLKLLLNLIEKVMLNYLKTKKVFNIPKMINNIDIEGIKSIAIHNYFIYNNKVLPIFIQSNFNIETKSKPLKYAIIISGLHHLKNDRHIQSIIHQLNQQLETLLDNIIYIPPTLENIQAILISKSFNIKLPFLFMSTDKYLAFCQKAADLIGLHLAQPKLNKCQRLERDMTYSSLCTTNLFYRINIALYLNLPYKSSTLSQQFNKMIWIINYNGNKKIKYGYDYYFNITMGSYNNQLSSILFSLRLLKEKYLNNHQDLFKPTETLIERVKHLSAFYLFIFGQHNNKLCQSNILQFNYKHHLLFIHHYLMYYIFSLKLYHPIQTTTSTTLIDSLEDTPYINQILLHCQLSIYHRIQLSYDYLIQFHIGCLSQCILFLLRYKKYSKLDCSEIINKGINYLNELTKMDRFGANAQLNLNTIGFVRLNVE